MKANGKKVSISNFSYWLWISRTHNVKMVRLDSIHFESILPTVYFLNTLQNIDLFRKSSKKNIKNKNIQKNSYKDMSMEPS